MGAVEVYDSAKVYKSDVRALDGVSLFSIQHPPRIVVGSNGAGKTLRGSYTPSTSCVDVVKDAERQRSRLCLKTPDPSLTSRLGRLWANPMAVYLIFTSSEAGLRDTYHSQRNATHWTAQHLVVDGI